MFHLTSQNPSFLPHCQSDVEIYLIKGDLITLVGENGVGKSTLIKNFYEKDPSRFSLIEQHSMDFFYDRSLKKIYDIFVSSFSDRMNRSKLEEYWNLFGLHKKEQRKLSTLSGGEKQILKICLGLCLNRELYILDEPSQSLDASARQLLNNLVGSLRKEEKTFLIVEHDLDWIKQRGQVFELSVSEHILRISKKWTI